MSRVIDENKAKKQAIYTYKIMLKGLVQGVGFRPFVYQLAKEFGVLGQVNNGSEGIEIVFNGNENLAQNFYQKIISQAPPLAQINFHSIEIVDNQAFNYFKIIESSSLGKVSSLLTPDFGMCADCRLELYDKQNRRYRYPFITCTNCGPRYSIINKLPYDRPQTSMKDFVMCKVCETEYNDPNDRRFYAQTNACTECGPKLSWYKTFDEEAQQLSELQDEKWILKQVKWAFEAGKIVAIKGIGGYLLMCDATNEKAVLRLRERKNRPIKPFAVLFPNIKFLEKEAFLSKNEAEALQSVAAPIVLVKQKETKSVVDEVNPNLKYMGAMLPYTPLLDLIAHDFGKPLVATSGNISSSPIIFEDEKALTALNVIADYILTNNRPIVIPQDDSVIRFSGKYQQKIIIRRGRGFPLFVERKIIKNEEFIAFGASLKSTFSIQNAENLYVSQYLGDLESFETQENFEQELAHFSAIFNFTNEKSQLICDAHEGYFSTQLAQQLGEKWKIPVQKIQHHQAHLAAVLAENGLALNDETVLGIIWDGTGYGTDGNMWGGEFFIKNQRFHFDYFDAILGDKMPREPRISAFCLTHNLVGFETITNAKFTAQEWNLYQKIIKNNMLKTSSLGRIFDGIACLLGLSEKQTFEGEAAMQLEELASNYFEENSYDFKESYFTEILENVPTKQLIMGVLKDLSDHKNKNYIAAKFHYSLVDSIEKLAKRFDIKRLAFSGGVFQNTVLVDLIIHHLSKDFQLFFHKNLSPNDENISFGQMVSHN